MNIKLISTFIAVMIVKSSNVFAIYKECIDDLRDPSLCSFDGVEKPDDLYKLSPLTVSNAFKIKKIKFKNTRMYHLPSEVTKTYVNLENLDISQAHISRFDGMDFADSNKITILNASFNAVHLLPKGISQKLTYLNVLDISNNYIEIIEKDAFSYNRNFSYLNLSNNIIEVIDRDFLIAIRGVKVLNLSFNKISEIRGDLSDISFEFEEVYLNDNHLKTIEPLWVQNLKVLDVCRNNLEGHFNFQNMKFKELKICSNFIDTLNIGNALEKLDASNSNERMFKIYFGTGSSLTELKLSNLDIVDYDYLLSQIKQLKSLESLDISHNNLESFDFQEAAKSLKFLNLERTNLRSIDNLNDTKKQVPNLMEINIQDNLFGCKELPKIIEIFKKQNINVIGYIDDYSQEFIEKNCAKSSHRGDHHHQVCNSGSAGTLIFFFVVSLLINFVCAAAFLYNKYVVFGSNSSKFLLRNFQENHETE